MYSLVLSLNFLFWFPLYSFVCIRATDGVARHFNRMQARFIAFLNTDKVVLTQLHRKQLKRKIKDWINKVGPLMFKNFDKLQMIRKQGKDAGSRSNSKRSTPYNLSRNASKSDMGEIDLNYMDELEVSRAFECLKELENI